MRLLNRDRPDRPDRQSDDLHAAPPEPGDGAEAPTEARPRPATQVPGLAASSATAPPSPLPPPPPPPATGAAGDAEARPTVRERTWSFTPAQIVSFAVGSFLVVVGLIVLLRAGVDGSLATPTVEVLTYRHTAWLGLVEIGAGSLLVLASSGTWGRVVSVVVGAAIVVGGVLVLAEPSRMPSELGTEQAYGWPVAALGALVAVAAMALPVWRRRALRDEEIQEFRARVVDLRGSDEATGTRSQDDHPSVVRSSRDLT